MPRRAKLDAEGARTIHKAEEPGAGHNGVDPGKVKRYVREIEAEQTEIDGIMADARASCLPHAEEIAKLKKAAAENGIPKKELAAALRYRRLEAKKQAIRSGLHEEQRDTYDQIQQALGDYAETPLGQAALAGAEQPELSTVS